MFSLFFFVFDNKKQSLKIETKQTLNSINKNNFQKTLGHVWSLFLKIVIENSF